jgi:hypothetical protein
LQILKNFLTINIGIKKLYWQGKRCQAKGINKSAQIWPLTYILSLDWGLFIKIGITPVINVNHGFWPWCSFQGLNFYLKLKLSVSPELLSIPWSVHSYLVRVLDTWLVYSDLCTNVRVLSSKVFLIPRKLIFGRNVSCVGLFKICSNGLEFLNIFQTGSEKPQKVA